MGPFLFPTMDNDNEIMRALGRVEGQLTSLLAMEAARSEAHTALERRVSAVESRVSRAYGIGAGLTAAGAFVGYVVRVAFGGH